MQVYAHNNILTVYPHFITQRNQTYHGLISNIKLSNSLSNDPLKRPIRSFSAPAKLLNKQNVNETTSSVSSAESLFVAKMNEYCTALSNGIQGKRIVFTLDANGKINTTEQKHCSEHRNIVKNLFQTAQEGLPENSLISLKLLHQARVASKNWSKDLKVQSEKEYQSAIKHTLQELAFAFARKLEKLNEEELLKNFNYDAKPNYAEECPNVAACKKLFGDLSTTVIMSILQGVNFQESCNLIEIFIDLASEALNQHNFAVAQAIFAGLGSSAITHLKQVWSTHISAKSLAKYNKLDIYFTEKTGSNERNRHFASDTNEPSYQPSSLPNIPSFPAILGTLYFLQQELKNAEESKRYWINLNAYIQSRKEGSFSSYTDSLEKRLTKCQDDPKKKQQVEEKLTLAKDFESLKAKYRSETKTKFIESHGFKQRINEELDKRFGNKDLAPEKKESYVKYLEYEVKSKLKTTSEIQPKLEIEERIQRELKRIVGKLVSEFREKIKKNAKRIRSRVHKLFHMELKRLQARENPEKFKNIENHIAIKEKELSDLIQLTLESIKRIKAYDYDKDIVAHEDSTKWFIWTNGDEYDEIKAYELAVDIRKRVLAEETTKRRPSV